MKSVLQRCSHQRRARKTNGNAGSPLFICDFFIWERRGFPFYLRCLRSYFASPSSGSTLIEVIISIGIVALVLVTIVASGTLVTRNRRFSANQGIATKYSQETIEWVRDFRNSVGWKTFYDSVSAKGASPITVCMPLIASAAADFDALTAGACAGTDVIANTEYQRSLVFTVASSSEIAVDAKITWSDNELQHETSARAVLREWQ